MSLSEKRCTLLFLVRDNEVLLAMKKRGFGSGRYNGVGGKVESNETVDQALVRECQEEIQVTPLHYWKVAEHDFLQTEGDLPWRMRVQAFLCDTWEGEPTETEEMAPEWFEMSEVPYGTMWQDDILWLPQVLQGEKLLGEFTFDKDENMLTHKVTTTKEFTDGHTFILA